MKLIISFICCALMVLTVSARENDLIIGAGDTLILSMDTVFSSDGEMVEMDVVVCGFQEIAVFEGSIMWDTLGLDFVEVTNFGLNNLADANFGQPVGTKDKLTWSWTEPAVSGGSVPDSTVLFTLVFNVIGGDVEEAAVMFADEPLDVSAADKNLEPVEIREHDGLVRIITPFAVSANVQNISCSGGSDGFIALDVSGASGDYSYMWSNGAATDSIGGLTAGTYAFTITDTPTGLQLVDSIPLISPDSILLEIKDVSADEDSLATVSVTVSGGVSPYSYAWSNGDSTAIITEVENGTYGLTVTDALGCVAEDSVVVNRMSSSLTEIVSDAFFVFPNPTSGLINVRVEQGSIARNWRVFNAVGEVVKQGRVNHPENGFTIDISEFTPGMYTLTYGRESRPVVLVK